VTPVITKEAYYSRYAGNPLALIKPGMVGTVGAVDVPCVYRVRRRYYTFLCVDFVLPGVFHGNPKLKNCKWRCSFYPDEIRRAN
jgi:hypothetical protein